MAGSCRWVVTGTIGAARLPDCEPEDNVTRSAGTGCGAAAASPGAAADRDDVAGETGAFATGVVVVNVVPDCI